MCDSELGCVFSPEWREVNVKADFAAAVHFHGFAIKLGQLEFDWCIRVGSWNLKLQIKVIADEIVVEPALATPLGAVLVTLYLEPVIVILLVKLYVLNQRCVLLFESLDP